MKVTKLPDVLDPNVIVYNMIKEQYSVCPFCGEKRSEFEAIHQGDFNGGIAFGYSSRSWYGKQDEEL